MRSARNYNVKIGKKPSTKSFDNVPTILVTIIVVGFKSRFLLISIDYDTHFSVCTKPITNNWKENGLLVIYLKDSAKTMRIVLQILEYINASHLLLSLLIDIRYCLNCVKPHTHSFWYLGYFIFFITRLHFNVIQMSCFVWILNWKRFSTKPYICVS